MYDYNIMLGGGFVIVVILLFLGVCEAFVEEKVNSHFAAYDSDGDGFLGRKEYISKLR